MAEAAPSSAPERAWRPREAKSADPTRAPERARPKRGPAETREGIKGVLSPIISPTMSVCRRAEARSSPRKAKGVARRPERSPREAARASSAGAANERTPEMAASATVRRLSGETSMTRSLFLGKGAPDFQLRADVADHLVGELRGAGGAAEGRGPEALQDGLECRLVDRPRGAGRLLLVGEGEEGRAGQ